jgi:hypothetical protein
MAERLQIVFPAAIDEFITGRIDIVRNNFLSILRNCSDQPFAQASLTRFPRPRACVERKSSSHFRFQG